MSWGCKPENKPDGCGWAGRVTYGRATAADPRVTEWWCDLCERAGTVTEPPLSDGEPA